jgi:hypothetical protein
MSFTISWSVTGQYPDGIGRIGPRAESLYNNHRRTLAEDSKLFSLANGPLDASFNIFFPRFNNRLIIIK